MKTLLITRHYPYPAHTGAKIYSSQIIEALDEICSEVTVLCGHEEERFFKKGITSWYCYPNKKKSILELAASIYPVMVRDAYNKNATNILKKILVKNKPDVVLLDHLAASWAYDFIKSNADIKIIYVSHNVEFDNRLQIAREHRNPVKKIINYIDLIKTYFQERKITKYSHANICISAGDKDKNISLYGVKKFMVLNPVYWKEARENTPLIANRPRAVCLSGSYLWQAKQLNLMDFLQEGYEKLVSNDIKIIVAGKSEPEFQKRCHARWPKVIFTGEVENIETFLDAARIGVISEKVGGGFKLKQLDYIFNRIPVFALSGTLADVPLVHARSCMEFTNMQNLISGIIEHIDQSEFLETLRLQAYADSQHMLVKNNFNNVLRETLKYET